MATASTIVSRSWSPRSTARRAGGPLALQLPYDPDQAIFDIAADEPTPVLQVRQGLVGEADEPASAGTADQVDWRVPLEGA